MAINLGKNELPNQWIISVLPEFTRIVMGQSPSSETYNFDGMGLPFFQGKAEFGTLYPTISKYCSVPNKIADEGATLLSVRAPVGPTNLANTRCCIGRGLAAIHPMGGMDPKFILLLFRSIEPNLSGEGTGSTFSAITKTFVDDLKFAIPPINEQKRIVAKIEELFSELDNGIATLKTAREQFKIYRQAVLIHAFEGKLTAKWREHNNIAKSSWLDTTVQKLALSGPSNGRSVKDRAGGFPVLRLTALKNGKIDLKESKEGAWDKDDAHKYIVNEGDFLFSRGNGSKHLVGRGGLVTKALFDVAFPDTIMRISLDKTKVSPSFFSYLWESRLIRSQIERSARTTAGIYKINQQHVKGFRLMLPSLTEQKVITRIIEEKLSVVDAQLDELEQQIAKAEILRQSILKKAFSGQLVPQDPNDEPASELLARIQAEKKTVSPQKTKKTRKIHSTPGH
ncbi:restriction endonuclease subunit S [Citrobacter koseri]|uniref:restriction endonuclease subunit S n=1 Tax=Citrobacter koseri TaxID=545 RepID=UPI0038927984